MAKETRIKVAGVWRNVASTYVNVGGTWRDVVGTYVNVGGVWKEVLSSGVGFTISTNVANFNLFTALGSPSSAVNIVLTINSGIQVYSTSALNPSLDYGALPVGSTVELINNGLIYGAGGNGGTCLTGASGQPSPGQAGGTAINMTAPTTITNAGSIFGGGGGGGAAKHPTAEGGAAGGGGQGQVGGTAGGTIPNQYNYSLATNGSVSAPGVGGNYYNTEYGGAGGGWGVNGVNASASQYNTSVGGVAGKAIQLNGNAVTWISGNNGTQVKGAQA